MRYYLLPLLVIFTLISCVKPKYSGETVLFEKSSPGTVYVRSGGYGSSKSEAISNSISNALTNILIHGIPNSNQELPILGNDALNIFNSNKKYFEKLFSQPDEFILKKESSDFKFFNTNMPSLETKLLINTSAIRKRLEKDNILRPFGI